MKRSSTVLSLAVMAILIGGAVQAGPSRHEDDRGRDGYSQRGERGEQRDQSKSRQVTVKKVTVTKGNSGKAMPTRAIQPRPMAASAPSAMPWGSGSTGTRWWW